MVQYLFGVCYYIVLGLTVLCSDRLGKGKTEISPLSTSDIHWFCYVVLMFVLFRDWNPPLSAGLVSCSWKRTFYLGLADAASIHGPAGQAPHRKVR